MRDTDVSASKRLGVLASDIENLPVLFDSVDAGCRFSIPVVDLFQEEASSLCWPKRPLQFKNSHNPIRDGRRLRAAVVREVWHPAALPKFLVRLGKAKAIQTDFQMVAAFLV